MNFQSPYSRHFVNVQAIVSFSPMHFLDVSIVLGHNNDKGTFNLTRTGDLIESWGVRLLGDSAYHHVRITTPDAADTVLFEGRHISCRAIVENAFAFVESTFRYVGGRSRLQPELHAAAVMVCFQLSNIILDHFPRSIVLAHS